MEVADRLGLIIIIKEVIDLFRILIYHLVGLRVIGEVIEVYEWIINLQESIDFNDDVSLYKYIITTELLFFHFFTYCRHSFRIMLELSVFDIKGMNMFVGTSSIGLGFTILTKGGFFGKVAGYMINS